MLSFNPFWDASRDLRIQFDKRFIKLSIPFGMLLDEIHKKIAWMPITFNPFWDAS